MQNLNDGRYDSVADFSDDAVNVLRNPRGDNKYLRDGWAFRDRRGDWYGGKCDTGKDVQKLIAAGWTEGRKRVDSFLSKLESIELAPRDMRRRLTRADMGDHLDITAVYAGRFQTAWTRAQRQSGFGPQRVDIVANMVCSGGDPADVLFWRGAAAVALCDKLEAAGYMVRLIVGFGGTGGGCEVSCRITVKDHDRPLDLATTSSVILPGFFRALGHAWIAGHHPRQASPSGISVGRCKLEPGEIFLSHGIRNESTARQTVENEIRKIDEAANKPQEAAE